MITTVENIQQIRLDPVPALSELNVLIREQTTLSRVNFDPVREATYLSGLDVEIRLPQLQKEVVATLAELKFSEIDVKYRIKDNRLVDDATGIDLETLTARGGNFAEVEAIRKLNQCLGEGKNLVVHISPEDKDLKYFDNMVDIWKSFPDGSVKVLRCRTVGGLETFRNLYKDLGGEVMNPNKTELLANPIQVKKLRLAEIMNLMVIEKCEERFEVKDVDRIAGSIIKDFKKNFGDRLTVEPNVILRYYLAVKDAVEKLGKSATKAEINFAVDRVIREMPIDTYLHASFTTRSEGGSHCGIGVGGEFSKGQGWILEVHDGKLTSHFGSVEGMTHCEECGCWHAGSQCPYCDQGYAANC